MEARVAAYSGGLRTRKQPEEILGGHRINHRSGHAFDLRHRIRDLDDKPGLIGTTTMWHRGKIRRVCLDQQAFERNLPQPSLRIR